MTTSASTGQIICPGLRGLNSQEMRECQAFFTTDPVLWGALAAVREHAIVDTRIYVCGENHALCRKCANSAVLRMQHASNLNGLLPREFSDCLNISYCPVNDHLLINELTQMNLEQWDEFFAQCFSTRFLFLQPAAEERRPTEQSYKAKVFVLFLAFFCCSILGVILDKEFPTVGEPHLCINGSSTGGFTAFCNLFGTFAAMFGIPPAILNQFAAIGPNATNAWGQWAVQGCHPAIAPLYNLSIPTCFPIPPALGPITESPPVTQMLAYAWEMLAPTLAAQGIGFINGTVANVWVLKRTLASCLQIMNQGIPGVLLPSSLIRAMQIYWLDPNNVPPDVLAQLKQALQRILDLYLHQQWGPAIENFPRN